MHGQLKKNAIYWSRLMLNVFVFNSHVDMYVSDSFLSGDVGELYNWNFMSSYYKNFSWEILCNLILTHLDSHVFKKVLQTMFAYFV